MNLMTTRLLSLLALAFFWTGCTPSKTIGRAARRMVLEDPALATAHVGITVYDPESKVYLYNYQGDKYFVPASNTKLPTCYAAMKYLGDSLVGLRYELAGEDLFIEPSADPTFLHPDFKSQPALDFLKRFKGTLTIDLTNWLDERWGSGWSWNDFAESYMAERSLLPIYGNVAIFSGPLNQLSVIPSYFSNGVHRDSTGDWNFYPQSVEREMDANHFVITGGQQSQRPVTIPFVTDKGRVTARLLSDTLKRAVFTHEYGAPGKNPYTLALHSQPTDSLLKPMMHRSDNFFAEQSLLMVSNEVLGVMSDQKIIDTLMKTDFRDLPQRPRWVDGSGLSRYNLFTPQDLVAILDKMRTEFGMDRVKEILPTGNEGTLTHYYGNESGSLFAKTGTLSGVVALSGFLYTRKNKLLIFSVLVNNHRASATDVRRAVERFVTGLRE